MRSLEEVCGDCLTAYFYRLLDWLVCSAGGCSSSSRQVSRGWASVLAVQSREPSEPPLEEQAVGSVANEHEHDRRVFRTTGPGGGGESGEKSPANRPEGRDPQHCKQFQAVIPAWSCRHCEPLALKMKMGPSSKMLRRHLPMLCPCCIGVSTRHHVNPIS